MIAMQDDPYSRLKALERMGVVADYSKLYSKTVVVIGVGGVGAVASEMLTRCGIGRLILIDFDYVEKANLNRLFYRYEHVGLKKVEAASKTLKDINPKVDIVTYDINVCYKFKELLDIITTGGIDNKQVDILLSCVDNYGARVTISKACTQSDQIWMNSGVSEDAMNGQIQTCIPGVTACFMCAPPFVVATNGDESEIKRGEVCVASLPTTMGVVAGLLVQNALKHLLEFGEVSNFLGYNSKQDFFPSYTIRPNPECSDDFCIELSKKKEKLQECLNTEKGEKSSQSAEKEAQPDNEAPPVSEYGITIVSTDTLQNSKNNQGGKKSDMDNKNISKLTKSEDSLENLRKKLTSLNTTQ